MKSYLVSKGQIVEPSRVATHPFAIERQVAKPVITEYVHIYHCPPLVLHYSFHLPLLCQRSHYLHHKMYSSFVTPH